MDFSFVGLVVASVFFKRNERVVLGGFFASGSICVCGVPDPGYQCEPQIYHDLLCICGSAGGEGYSEAYFSSSERKE